MKIKSLSRHRLFVPALGILAVIVAGLIVLPGRGVSQGGDAAYAVLEGDSAVSRDALRAAIDPLFDNAAEPATGETRALIVMRNGKVIAERYAPGFGPQDKMLSWSIAKTVTSLLVGIMVSDGRLALDDPAPVPAWRQPGDPRAAITLRQLLQMSAGLDYVETDGPPEKTDGLRMLVGPGAQDQLAYAEARPLIHEPGTHFTYSGGNSVLMAGLMASALTRDPSPQGHRNALMQFIETRLTAPLGITSFVPEFDAQGTMIAGAMMHMTARDYAKIGELMRLRGRVGDRQLLPARWIDFMTRSSPANPAYGGHVWLNRAGDPSELFPGQARASVFGALGYRGQYLLVSPEQGLTIVRLGVTRAEDKAALNDAMASLVRRFP